MNQETGSLLSEIIVLFFHVCRHTCLEVRCYGLCLCNILENARAGATLIMIELSLISLISKLLLPLVDMPSYASD